MYRCTACATEWLATPSAPLHCPGCGSLAFVRLSNHAAGISVNNVEVEHRSVVTVRDLPSPGVHALVAARLAGVSLQAQRATVRTRLVGESKASRLRQPDFEVDQLIARGGMGEVMAARQVSLDREVALKRLPEATSDDDEANARFLAEAVLTANLDHPGIVPIHELGIDQHGRPFYVMKRIRGEPWNVRYRRMTLDENLDVLMRIGDAVAFAHMRGIVHRDLKPENVMLGDFGEVLVVDWGLAVAINELHSNLHAARLACGTPAYMAPEQASGDYASIGPCSDVYLLGATLYEIITGTPPHPGTNPQTSLVAAANNVIEPRPPKGELGELALKAMSTNPADRFADVRAFQQALRGYRSHAQSEALANAASTALARTKTTASYDDFARAMYGYEEALTLWPGNFKAREGATLSRIAYAEHALKNGDLDLANSLSVKRSDSGLQRRISVARLRRQYTRRRIKILTVVSGILLAATLITLATSVIMTKMERAEVVRALRERDNAERRLASLERRDWNSVFSEDFGHGHLPNTLVTLQGEWTTSRNELVARGPGTSQVALAKPLNHSFRINYDWIVERPHRLHIGVTDYQSALETGGITVIFGRTCEVLFKGQSRMKSLMPTPIQDLPQHVRIELDGGTLLVLVDGRQIARVEVGIMPSFPTKRGLILAAEPGATFDNVHVEQLGEPESGVL